VSKRAEPGDTVPGAARSLTVEPAADSTDSLPSAGSTPAGPPSINARRLTPEKVEAIQVALRKGVPQNEVARKYRVSPSTVSAIKNGLYWNDVTKLPRRRAGGWDLSDEKPMDDQWPPIVSEDQLE
jgi:hypothetical protein